MPRGLASDEPVVVVDFQLVPNQVVRHDVSVAKRARPIVVATDHFVVVQGVAPVVAEPRGFFHRAAVRRIQVGQEGHLRCRIESVDLHPVGVDVVAAVVVQRALVFHPVVVRDEIVRAQNRHHRSGVRHHTRGHRLGVHGACHGPDAGDFVVQSAGQIVGEPTPIGIPHGVHALWVHALACHQRIHEVGDEVDVAVRVGHGEGQFARSHHLPIRGSAVVGVGQGLRVGQDDALLVGAVPHVGHGQLAFSRATAPVEVHDKRPGLVRRMPVRQVQQVGSGVAIDHKGFRGQLSPRHANSCKDAEYGCRDFREEGEL